MWGWGEPHRNDAGDLVLLGVPTRVSCDEGASLPRITAHRNKRESTLQEGDEGCQRTDWAHPMMMPTATLPPWLPGTLGGEPPFSVSAWSAMSRCLYRLQLAHELVLRY